MSLFFLGNAMLFMGAFALQFGLFDTGETEDETETTATPEPEPDLRLYDAAAYSAETTGTGGDDSFADTSPLNQAYFLMEGADTLDATNGADYADGGAGDDFLEMRQGNDIAFGGEGDDYIDAGLGDDLVYGEDGNDSITGSKGDDQVFGGDGNDTLIGSDGADTLEGGLGNDTLFGNLEGDPGDTTDGIDNLDGGSGDDALHMGGGDIGTGGEGADGFFLYDPQTSGAVAEITDFNSDDDVISVVYEPVSPGAPDPVLTLTANADNTAATLAMDGVDIANIIGGQDLAPGDIALVPSIV